MSEKNIDKKQNNPKLIIAAICVGVVIIALLVIIILLMSDKENQKSINTENIVAQTESTKPKRKVLIKEENVNEIVSEFMNEEEDIDKVAPGFYEVVMNSDWEFENGSVASQNAYVENSKANENAVYFDIIRSDTNETIYESPILTVGMSMDEIKLDTELPAGEYKCVCVYNLLDEEYEPVSTVSVALRITIKN